MSCSSQSDSESCSLFSHPMTRASSAATKYSDSLVTPLSEKVPTPLKRDMNGPRKMSRSSRIHAANDTHSHLDPLPESSEMDFEPRGSYFSIPVDCTSSQISVQRNKSTKDLIRRFESLECDSSALQAIDRKTRLDQKTLVVQRDFRSGGAARGTGMQKPQNRSPLRRSFGNLLAIFGKKPKTSVDEDNLLSTPYKSDTLHPAINRNLGDLSVSALFAGPLLYLCPPASSGDVSLPVWTDCTTTLFSTRILATWHTSQGNPHSHTIQLNTCIDVHSLAMEELDTNEIALLPTRDLKVFALLFKDKPTEKFVASSVQERASWISAIWDVVLGNHELGSITPVEPMGNPPGPEITHSSSSAIPMAPRASNYDPERDLPPTPVSPPHLYIPDIRSPRPPRPQPLLPCRPTSSSPRSFSLLNLDKRSVVTTRLDQIERKHSIRSFRSQDGDNDGGLESGLKRRESTRSTGGDSLLDLYGDDSVCSSTWNRRSTLMAPKLELIPEASPLTSEQRSRMQDIDSPTSIYTAAHPDMRLGPLVELLQDQATKHYYHTNDLGDQIASLHSEVHGMFEELKVMVGEQTTEADKVVEGIETSMAGLEHRLRETKGSEGAMISVISVKEKLDGIHTEIRGYREVERSGMERAHQAVVEKLDKLNPGMKDQNAVPQAIVHELEMLRLAINARNGPAGVMLGNVEPSTLAEGPSSLLPDLSEVNAKLDTLLHEWKVNVSGGSQATETVANDHPELKEITTLLRADQSQRSVQIQQQTDSVRYLNELNAWLETFVSDGTSKIDAVASGVEHLRRALISIVGESDEGPDHSGGLLASIELLLSESKTRDQSLAVLHASVNGLFAAVNDRIVDSGNALTTEAVVGLLDQQRQHQEQMLRTVAADLSNDIKGERIRFVEAMKEATAINVQIHVEEFKRQLTQEVLLMTNEVGRLQKERQALEQQIADLFTFYTKQKTLTAGVMGLVPSPPGPK